MTDERLLTARGVVVRHREQVILDGCDLGIDSGEIVAVLGPTGAGKTTLFRALTGDRPPDGGEVWLRGQEVTSLPLWRRARLGIGYVPQTPSVLPDLTVLGNLETFRRIAGARGPTALDWARLVGLEHRARLVASRLSGGERRLLELARALTTDPALLVCDELFAGMDPVTARRATEILRARARQGLGVLVSDHRLGAVLRLCDRAMLLVGGRVCGAGPARDFAQDPLVQRHYLGWEPDADAAGQGLGVARPSLDQTLAPAQENRSDGNGASDDNA